MKKALNVAFYILSLPLRVAVVIIGSPIILSSIDWTQDGDARRALREASDIIAYPHY